MVRSWIDDVAADMAGCYLCVCVRARVQGVEIIRVGDWDEFLVVARVELSFGDIGVLEERRCWVVFIVSCRKSPRESLDSPGPSHTKSRRRHDALSQLASFCIFAQP